MDLRRLSCATLVAGAAVLAGCVTPVKPDSAAAPAGAAADVKAPAVTSTATDPMGRLRAFIAGDGLATAPARPGQGARLTASWNNKVIYAPDPVHGGNPVPGLMGKLWVFGPDESVPLSLDGEIFVGAWDNSAVANGGEPVLLEVWHLDPEAVRKLRRKDFFGGEAYNLFLPWSQYTVDLRQINVVARFNEADGRSLVSTPEILTLDHSTTLERAREKLAGLSADPVGRPAAAGPPPAPPAGTPLPINFPGAPRK
jgi:hypothetical protein